MQTFIIVRALNGTELDPAHTRALRQRLGAATRWRELPGALLGSTAQPVSLDGETWIVADARVDARDALAHDLGLPGIPSDEELILRAYEKWGEECAGHFIGDFAFAIWDGRQKKLFAARDGLGARVLYHAQADGLVIVANQMLAITAHPALPRRPNPAFIADFLLLGGPGDREIASFEGVRRLAAGHTLAAQRQVSLRQYWSRPIEDELRFKNPQEYVERFREIFEQAVEDRLRDATVTLSTSGGMDSSAIAAAITRVARKRNLPLNLRGVCIATSHPEDQERAWAAQMAAHVNMPLEFVELEKYSLFADADLDESDGQLDDQSQNELARAFDTAVAAHSRKLFTGVGGDVMLYPSSTYWLNEVKRGRLLKAAQAAREFRARAGQNMPLYIRTALRGQRRAASPATRPPDWIDPDFAAAHHLVERGEVTRRDQTSAHPTHPDAYRIMGFREWQFIFEKQTHARFEKLMPFFDERVMRFCLRVPSAPWCEDKLLLREAMRGQMPESVRTRRKTPFTADVLGPKFDAVDREAVLRQAAPLVAPYVSIERLRSHFAEKDRAFVQFGLTRVASLARWLRRFG